MNGLGSGGGMEEELWRWKDGVWICRGRGTHGNEGMEVFVVCCV